jgi:hypothetical protein
MVGLFIFDMCTTIALTALHMLRRGRHWSGMVVRRNDTHHKLTESKHRK